MKSLAVLRKIAPEMTDIVARRHAVLQTVVSSQPIGRRALAGRLGWPERMVRKEIDFLRDAGLLHCDPAGMEVSQAGKSVLKELEGFVRELHGLALLEKELATKLGLKRVIVVPGDADTDSTVKKEVAVATARFIDSALTDGDVLAVTGGTTLAEVARTAPTNRVLHDIVVVPARGGLGEDVELQANTVAATFAGRIGGSYRLLHIPDDLSHEAIVSISAEPKIKELIDLIRSARIVLHGIGTAEEMARRRGLPHEYVEVLRKRRAVGEAFGYYFDETRDIVYASGSVGLRLEDLERVDLVVAVGAGKSKAAAALAVLSPQHQDVYITDEGAAREMLAKLQSDESRERSLN